MITRRLGAARRRHPRCSRSSPTRAATARSSPACSSSASASGSSIRRSRPPPSPPCPTRSRASPAASSTCSRSPAARSAWRRSPRSSRRSPRTSSATRRPDAGTPLTDHQERRPARHPRRHRCGARRARPAERSAQTEIDADRPRLVRGRPRHQPQGRRRRRLHRPARRRPLIRGGKPDPEPEPTRRGAGTRGQSTHPRAASVRGAGSARWTAPPLDRFELLGRTLIVGGRRRSLLSVVGAVAVATSDTTIPFAEDVQRQGRALIAIASLDGGIAGSGVLAGLGAIVSMMVVDRRERSRQPMSRSRRRRAAPGRPQGRRRPRPREHDRELRARRSRSASR